MSVVTSLIDTAPTDDGMGVPRMGVVASLIDTAPTDDVMGVRA